MGSLVRDTNVLSTKEYKEWKWGALLALLEHPGIRVAHILEDAVFAK